RRTAHPHRARGRRPRLRAVPRRAGRARDRREAACRPPVDPLRLPGRARGEHRRQLTLGERTTVAAAPAPGAAGGHHTTGGVAVIGRSSDRILTIHGGELPAPRDVWARPEVADDRLREAVAEVVTAQRDAGVDFINEGELTKGGHWDEYLPTRLGGYSPAEGGAYTELLMSSKDWVDFQDFYLAVLQNGTLFEQSGATQHVPEGAEETTPTDDWIAAEPIHYTGHELLEREIAVMRDSLGDVDPSDAFLTTTAPLSVEPGRVKGIYASDEEHVYAIAEAMRVEYEAIAAAGFQVQVDDAWLGALWDRIGIP